MRRKIGLERGNIKGVNPASSFNADGTDGAQWSKTPKQTLTTRRAVMAQMPH